MKFVMSWLAAIVVGAAAFATVSEAAAMSRHRFFGPEVPLPTASALPFPWKGMDGYWQTNVNGTRSFLMKSYETAEGQKILRIVEYDPSSGVVLARGLALPVDGSEVVKAQMIGNGAEYELFMGSYTDDEDTSKAKTLFAVRAMGLDEGRSYQMVAHKIRRLHR